MTITNIVLTLIVILIAIFVIYYNIKKKKEAQVEKTVEVDDKTYTIDKMIEFVKRRLDEITKINLYDIGLSEEELKRRKNKKYALKKALKGCTYGDVNDKRYVKELIYDLLLKEYGVTETNISKAIPFDIPSLLTAQDKFDILYNKLQSSERQYDLEGIKQAYEFAAQSVLGSAKLLLETGRHPGELKDMVCSPGGTTIQAVKVLEEKGMRAAVMDAMEACIEKSRNM